MKIAIMPDSFKEGPDAHYVANSIEEGILSIDDTIETAKIPVSDGGDGLANRLIHASSGRFKTVKATGPLGDEIETQYGIIDNTGIALIESALTCGISLVPKEKRDPTIATSYGLGTVINKVIEDGYREIIIGLGGSATNDAGAGMLQSLGVSLKDKEENELPVGGLALKKIKHIDASRLYEKLPSNLKIKVACNPSSVLCGPKSTSLVYSKQKGATEEQSYKLDEALFKFGVATYKYTGEDIRYAPGSGGAGGIGAALKAYLGADLVHSIEVVKQYLPIEENIRKSDFVISAEGRFDERSVKGKIVGEIARISKKHNKPFFVLYGQSPEKLDFSYDLIDGAFCIVNEPSNLENAVQSTLPNLRRTSAMLTKSILRFSGGYNENIRS
ncbi:glycerate kinase [Candidatus Woesearchaeota archaeon]|nr:glycerate kinase [Candidatus Woesearchaeota archaeon]